MLNPRFHSYESNWTVDTNSGIVNFQPDETILTVQDTGGTVYAEIQQEVTVPDGNVEVRLKN